MSSLKERTCDCKYGHWRIDICQALSKGLVAYRICGEMDGGMMGSGSSQPAQTSPTDQLPITPEDVTQIAKDYISRNSLGMDTESPDQFYGYYTIYTKQNGEVNGMLSVNGYTGAVWYHTWHGPFVAMEEEDE